MSRVTNDVGEIEGSVVGTLEGWVRDPFTIIVNLFFPVFNKSKTNWIYFAQ